MCHELKKVEVLRESLIHKRKQAIVPRTSGLLWSFANSRERSSALRWADFLGRGVDCSICHTQWICAAFTKCACAAAFVPRFPFRFSGLILMNIGDSSTYTMNENQNSNRSYKRKTEAFKPRPFFSRTKNGPKKRRKFDQ